MIRVNNHILIIVCFLLFACKPDQLKWDLPRVNPLDTMVNSSGFQPITLQPVITSNTTAKIRGQLTPYSPSFEGQVAIDWKKLGESWDRVEATQNEQGVFEVVVYDLTPGATYMSRAVMIISASSLYGEELQFSMPVDNQQLGCTDPQACNYFSAATFDDGSCTYAMLFWIDFDDDGYGDMYAPPELDCPPLPNNAVFNGDDCDDYDNTVYPNAQSTQSGIDNDCSGEIEEDEEEPLYSCWFNNCSSLSNMDSDVTSVLCDSWEISPYGYEGSCLTANCAGWLEFGYSQSDPFTIRYWMIAYNAGSWVQYAPDIQYNGTNVESVIINGNNMGGDDEDWHQRETGIIPAGSGTIKITFSLGGSLFYSRRIDEIEFMCVP